ncbi:MAG TPA: hypothetical protein VHG29_08035 [Novosphingobium sp.]|nr:hypothetical protein [Novosphingobium sp.]
MGPGDFLAFVALLSSIIVISMVVLTGYRHRLRVKERQLELQSPKADVPTVDVDRLEQRLRVLERIATAKSTDLAAQIEDLREPAVN